MRAFYVTKKQVNNYIQSCLRRFDNVEMFKNEVDRAINDLSIEDKAQIKFLTRVRETLA